MQADRSRLVAVWARDKLDLSLEDYNEKVQVYKRLNKIWEGKDLHRKHPEFNSGGAWDQTNTVLIDDSILKASAQPHNLVEIPEFTKELLAQEKQTKVLNEVIDYLEQARQWQDVSKFIHKFPFRMGESKHLAIPSNASNPPLAQ